MKLGLRIDQDDGSHVHFTVFVDGKHTGTLCFGADEFGELRRILDIGCVMTTSYAGPRNTLGVWEPGVEQHPQ